LRFRYQWRIAFLIACAITISYFDRQTLPVAVLAIGREIPISNTAFSQLQAAFLVAYAVMYAMGGKLLDALGTRRGFLLIMLWWSLACASHGFATSFGMLAVSRFLLGMGEGGGFPAATKSVYEWFSVRERSLAMGIMNAGTAVGAVIAPPLIAIILSFASWRWVFFISGAAGVVWAIWWWYEYFVPGKHPRLVQTEKDELTSLVDLESDLALAAPIPWIQLFSRIEVWGLMTAKFLSDAGWYFYLFWLPKYLFDVRHFDMKQVGYSAWVPYAASGVGSLVGGWFSGWLIRQGKSVNFARKLALGLSAAVMPSILFVSHAPVEFALVIFSIAFFGQQSWSTLVMVLPTDLFPGKLVGSVAGLVGFGGAMGGVVFGFVVGYLLDHGFGYSVVFAMVSTFHLAAFLIILLTVRQMNTTPLFEEQVAQ
jgi:MFS transporter, ACS family, hexuronate transporter